MYGISYAKQYVIDQTDAISPAFKLNETKNTDNTASIAISDASDCELGSILIEKAMNSPFQESSKLTNKQLHNCAIIHPPVINDAAQAERLLPLFCYFGLRQARIWHCQNIILCISDSHPFATSMQTLLRLSPLTHCPEVSIDNTLCAVFAQRIKYAILHTYSRCDSVFKPFIQSHFINEILATFESWVEQLFKESWFAAIYSRTITKEQYITSLYNLHQFVKHTTRLAARCVAQSENRELRNHYLYHLKGEINHEIIIESDLAGLDGDVDYLLNSHVAHTATSEFIALQESIIGYKQDPVMMLACPFIAEGMTANIDMRFIEELHATIASWGIEKPESVSRFLTSHMKTDGGVDGHWLRVVMMTHKFIRSEQELQHFLCAMRHGMAAYAHGLNANIDDLELWRPTMPVAVPENIAV